MTEWEDNLKGLDDTVDAKHDDCQDHCSEEQVVGQRFKGVPSVRPRKLPTRSKHLLDE